MTKTLEISLPPDPGNLSGARLALNELKGVAPDDVLDNLRLMVSELLTNSIRHADLQSDDLIDLKVFVRPEMLRAEVRDSGPGFEVSPREPSLYQDYGWGLFLVGQLSDRWGVDKAAGSTTVWFEIDHK